METTLSSIKLTRLQNYNSTKINELKTILSCQLVMIVIF